jgi:hypothetical protein
MKTLILGALAAASLGSVALPASAQGIVIGENRHGNVVVRPAGVYEGRYHDGRGYYGHRYHHRHVWFDRWGHRHWG